MRDLSLHLLDIVQNSVRAQASRIDIGFDLAADGRLTMTVADDGTGMDPETLRRVSSPFTTSRTTRKVGLGIPLLMQNAELSGGSVHLESTLGKGTVVTAVFRTGSIDCLPLGDLPGSIVSLIIGNPDKPAFTLRCSSPAGEMSFSTEEVRAVLGPEVPLNEPSVVEWLQASLQEEIEPLLGGIMK